MPLVKLRELPWFFQFLILAVIAGGLVVGVEFLYFREMAHQNEENRNRLDVLRKDLANVDDVKKRHSSFQEANAKLEQQLAELHVVLPNNKETDDFIRQLQDIASKTNVRVLRLVAKQVSKKEAAPAADTAAGKKAEEASRLYSELPFTLELAGGYHGLGMFLDQMAHLQRIVNIGDLEIASITNASKIRIKAQSTSGLSDTVVATCTATTFFQSEP